MKQHRRLKKVAIFLFTAALLFSLVITAIAHSQNASESKWAVSRPTIAETSEGIETKLEVLWGENDPDYDPPYALHLIVTIPENFEGSAIDLANRIQMRLGAVSLDIGDDEVVAGIIGMQPGWCRYNITIVNNSKHSYSYVNDSFKVSTLPMTGKTPVEGAIGFDGIPLMQENGIMRTQTRALEKLAGTSGYRSSDEWLIQKLIENGYQGLEDLDKYYVDFYNTQNDFETKDAKTLDDFSIADMWLMSRFPSGKAERAEVDPELAEYWYNYFYNCLFSLVPNYGGWDSFEDPVLTKYSIGEWMRHQAEYDTDFMSDKLVFEAGTTVELPQSYLNINGKYTNNSFNFMDVGLLTGLQLQRTDTSYTIKHEYYTSTNGGAFVKDGEIFTNRSGEQLSDGNVLIGQVGDAIQVANLTKIDVFHGNVYTYMRVQPAESLILVPDSGNNIIVLRYERSVTETESTSSAPPADTKQPSDSTPEMLKTDDNSNMLFWYIVLALGIFGMTFTGHFIRKRNAGN